MVDGSHLGVVSGIATPVDDGQTVKAGDPLIQLENAELSNRAESLAGEIQTAAMRLNSLLALRLSSDGDPDQSSRLAMEEHQLKSELTNLRAQQEVVAAAEVRGRCRTPGPARAAGPAVAAAS